MQFAVLQSLLTVLYLGVALFVLVRSSEMFLVGAKKIGSSFGLSHFTIGVLIVALGTSLPELASSIAGVLQGNPEVVVASVVGSNIANILLIVGLLACIAGRIAINQELIKTELPIFFIATAHFILVVIDGKVDMLEGLLLLATFIVFAWYLVTQAHQARKIHQKKHQHIQFDIRAYILVFLGLIGVFVGAHYTVDLSVTLAHTFLVPVGLISIAAVIVGASLPELFISLHALRNKEVEVAIGNIFGANVINILVVIGIPALITPLVVEPVITSVGVPVLIAASMIFFVAGISKQIMRWEGIMMLLFFIFFLAKITMVSF
jgi:cation:H+ antiporter